MKIIAVEEHVNENDLAHFSTRLKDMDETGIDMQVLSYSFHSDKNLDMPGEISAARKVNETLSKIVEKYPDRFAAFAAITPQYADAAARELERAVKELGLKGTLIFPEDFFDDKKYRAIFETAARLDVPVYLHPGSPPEDMINPYKKYPGLEGAALGFGAQGSLHAMRLILSGLFDEYPQLKIILGHQGEGLPFWLWRLDSRLPRDPAKMTGALLPGTNFDYLKNLKKDVSRYFRDNFYVTTSGMFWHPVLQFVRTVLGPERVLFATDYPCESITEAAQFIKSAPLSENDKEMICHFNAEKLLRL